MGYRENYEAWLNSDFVDEKTKAELASLTDEDEIKLRFYQYLQFGTAGLRGTMNAGTNAMNVYTVRHATQGLANLIKDQGKEACDRGVAIAYDSRNNSDAFATAAAEVLAGNGIQVYIFASIRPTPVLSFTIRHLGCIAGINITASHNPKEYNGYKAYWEDGAQLPPEHASKVSDYIAAIDIFKDIKRIEIKDGICDGVISIIGREVDRAYLKNVRMQAIDADLLEEMAPKFSIVYTPLNGTGYRLIPELLSDLGFKKLYTVDEQMKPDGDFPTTPFPNPEYKQVFTMGTELAKQADSDLIIATDPDADRVGIAVRNGDGEFVTLTGNQVGALLTDYIINALKRKGKLCPEPYAVKSFVSTELATKICRDNGVTMYNVFTGFKFIGETINAKEIPGKREFLLGFEESYGYLRGTYARDKDAVCATMLICEMAAYYKKSDMTLYDALEALYKKYGYYRDGIDNLAMKGLDGIEKMKNIMASLRKTPPTNFGEFTINSVIDYAVPEEYFPATGERKKLDTGKTNTLYYKCGDDVVVIRPSGTEPKIKLYYLVSGKTAQEADGKVSALSASVKEIIDSF